MFNFEIRYTVLKHSDVHSALDADETELLIELENKITAYRKEKGKDELGCIVIEKDWPEFGPTLRRLEQRVNLEDANEACKKGSHLNRYSR